MTVSAPFDPKGIVNPIVEDGHPNCELNLSVTVNGGTAPYTYRWLRGTVLVGTAANLVIRPSSLTNQGIYTCQVTDSSGVRVTSPSSRVTVLNISESTSLAAVGQLTTTVNVAAQSPSSLSYRWYRMVGTNAVRLNSADAKYSGVTSATLTIRNVSVSDATTYFCRVFANGYFMDSGLKRLVVVPAPVSKIVSAGTSTELEVNPVGTTPSILSGLVYEWRRGTVVVGNSKILSIGNATIADAGDYTCLVRLTAGSAPTSSPSARIDVVTSTPRVQLVAQGAVSVVLTGEVTPATGRTFRWFKVGSAVPIANTTGKYVGATTNALTIQAINPSDAGDYYCEVTAYGVSVNTANRKLLVAGTPGSKLVRLNDPFQLQMVVHGSTPEIDSELTYVWRKAGVVQSTAEGANGAFFDDASAALTDAVAYTCAVSYPAIAATATPPVAQVSVVNPTATTKMILVGGVTTFTVETRGLGMSYEWSLNGNPIPIGVTPNYIAVAASPLLTIRAATLAQGGQYRCKVTAYGQTLDADFNRLVILSKPANTLVQLGASLTMQMTTSGEASPGDLTYKWYKAVGRSFSLVGEAPTFTISNAVSTDGSSYRCDVTLNSVSTPITVMASGILVSIIVNTPASHLGVATRSVSISMSASGPAVTYRWHKVGIGELPIETTLPVSSRKYLGVNTRFLTVQNLTPADAGSYFCVVNGYGVLTQLENQVLDVITSPTSSLALVGEAKTLSVASTGTIPSLNYQWKKVVGRGAVNLGGNSPDLNLAMISLSDGSISYTCEVSIPGMTNLTAKATTIAAALPVIDPEPLDVVANSTATATLRIASSGVVLPPNMTFTWFKMDGTTAVPVLQTSPTKYLGLTGTALSILRADETDAGDYFCEISAYGRTVQTSPVNLFVRFRPELLSVSFPLAIIGGQFSYQIPVNSDPRKVPTSFTAAPLPAGLTLNPSTGVISGRPTAAFNSSVTITARNLAGVSDSVVANLTVSSLPTYLSGTYVGVIPRSASFGTNLGGRFDMTVTASGAASGSLRLGTVVYPFAVGSTLNVVGTNSSTATATASILVPRGTGTSALPSLRVRFSIDNSSILTGARIEGDANPSEFIEFEGWRNSFSVSSPATSYQASVYNFGLLPPSGSDSVTIPQGVGHGYFSITNLGAYSITGRTADGEAILSSGFVGPTGQAFIYQSMYLTTEKGSLLGAFNVDTKGNTNPLDNSIEASVTIPVTWSRPVDTRTASTPPTLAQRTYRAGFNSHELVMEGSVYLPPTAPNVFLNVVPPISASSPNVKITFTDGGIQSSTSTTSIFEFTGIRIGVSSLITMLQPNNATVTLAPVATNGRFTGSFVMRDGTVSRPTTSYQGVVYTRGGALKAVGYYLHSTKALAAASLSDLVLSGSVKLEPLP